MSTPTPTTLDAETLLDVYDALAGDESRLCRKRALLAVRDHVLAHARPAERVVLKRDDPQDPGRAAAICGAARDSRMTSSSSGVSCQACSRIESAERVIRERDEAKQEVETLKANIAEIRGAGSTLTDEDCAHVACLYWGGQPETHLPRNGMGSQAFNTARRASYDQRMRDVAVLQELAARFRSERPDSGGAYEAGKLDGVNEALLDLVAGVVPSTPTGKSSHDSWHLTLASKVRAEAERDTAVKERDEARAERDAMRAARDEANANAKHFMERAPRIPAEVRDFCNAAREFFLYSGADVDMRIKTPRAEATYLRVMKACPVGALAAEPTAPAIGACTCPGGMQPSDPHFASCPMAMEPTAAVAVCGDIWRENGVTDGRPCVKPRGHSDCHEDAQRGEWTNRTAAEPTAAAGVEVPTVPKWMRDIVSGGVPGNQLLAGTVNHLVALTEAVAALRGRAS